MKNESQVWNVLIQLCDVKKEVERLTPEISSRDVYSSIVDVATSNLYVLLRKVGRRVRTEDLRRNRFYPFLREQTFGPLRR